MLHILIAKIVLTWLWFYKNINYGNRETSTPFGGNWLRNASPGSNSFKIRIRSLARPQPQCRPYTLEQTGRGYSFPQNIVEICSQAIRGHSFSKCMKSSLPDLWLLIFGCPTVNRQSKKMFEKHSYSRYRSFNHNYY